MRYLYLALSIACLLWAGWSIIRFLFLPPSISGDFAGWKWILSIFIEFGLASLFYSLAQGDKN